MIVLELPSGGSKERAILVAIAVTVSLLVLSAVTTDVGPGMKR